MQATFATRNEYRFTGQDDVVYGHGLTEIEAVRDAEGRIGETMFTQDDVDANSYLVIVKQRRDTDTGEWIDVK
ncbi:hypothetical protein [Burkholderia vietnamiensis]|uniref:hypothetical protein n=1 Tax=Burkholderia vietnamiensis TaxID=60552 RepID=UPI0015935465|nr:hypothetical protein [Burkholderia vietnamiensis]